MARCTSSAESNNVQRAQEEAVAVDAMQALMQSGDACAERDSYQTLCQ